MDTISISGQFVQRFNGSVVKGVDSICMVVSGRCPFLLASVFSPCRLVFVFQIGERLPVSKSVSDRFVLKLAYLYWTDVLKIVQFLDEKFPQYTTYSLSADLKINFSSSSYYDTVRWLWHGLDGMIYYRVCVSGDTANVANSLTNRPNAVFQVVVYWEEQAAICLERN